MPRSSARDHKKFVLLVLMLIALATLACSRATNGQRFLERGKKFTDQKDYTRAILELKNAAKASPNDAEVYYQLGLVYLALGDYRTAYGNLVRATELNPNHTSAQNKLAELIGSSVGNSHDPQQLQEAEQRVQAVLAVVPNSTEALTALGRTKYALGQQ